MKKFLTVGVSSLALAASISFGAFAVGTGNSTHDVTIGSVDETVYSVDIDWGDMAFDYKYDDDLNSFYFKPHLSCSASVYGWVDGADYLNNFKNKGLLFSDSTCKTTYTDDIDIANHNINYYAKSDVGGRIKITDSTQNGKVAVSAAFTPETAYNWVEGSFYQDATVENWNTELNGNIKPDVTIDEIDYHTKITGNIPFLVGSYSSRLAFAALLLQSASSPSTIVSASDKIGTITLTISPDTE